MCCRSTSPRATPRLPFGSNLAAHWGFLYSEIPVERVTIYELDTAASLGRALFGYDWTATPLADQPGTLVSPDNDARQPALAGVVVPLRPHFGTMGVAPAAPERVSSVPPGDHGGNVDNWRIGAGGRCTTRCRCPAHCCSSAISHVSQGDGEVSGTALEASLNGLLRLTIRRDLPFTVPVLETATELLVHGFGDTLDAAMKSAALRTHSILQSYLGLSRADAYSFMSVAADFTVTQVVDQRQGVHGRIGQALFPSMVRGAGMTDNGIRSFTFTPADGVPPAVAPFAHATAAGPTLHVTGQMPTDVTGAVVGDYVAIQTDQVLRNLLRVTELCGGGMADVISVRAYLLNWDDYDAFNAAYAAWLPTGCRRARVSASRA